MIPELLHGKSCVHCKAIKSLDEFYVDKSQSEGRRSWCKECTCKANRERRAKNPEKYREAVRKCQRANPEKLRESQKRYYMANIEKCRENGRRWVKRHLEKYREGMRVAAKKRRNTLKGRLEANIKCSIWKSLREAKADRSWELLVGYNVDDLKRHLEKQFIDGMTWANYGKWHIDHKIPISAFNFEKPEDIDFQRCFSLKNLQPLWAKENVRKQAKLDEVFQPSLLIREGELLCQA